MESCFRILGLFRIVGLIMALVGLVGGFLNLRGWFVDPEKVAIAGLVRTSQSDIPRGAQGFEKLLDAFPPPGSLSPASVTAITTTTYQTPDPYPVVIIVRYVADGRSTDPVVSYEEIRRWSEQSQYGWFSWVVSLIGWTVLVAVEVLSRLK